MTDFPPPPGFSGWERGEWGGWGYERECTPEEIALLEADLAAAEAEERAQSEADRDTWFAAPRAGIGTDQL